MDSTKPSILIMVDWYLPGYKAGGPIQSVANLAELIMDDVHVHIFTSDRDHMDSEAYSGVKLDEWVQMNRYKVFYSSQSKHKSNVRSVLNERPWDKVYLNSFFSPGFTLQPMLELWKRRALSHVILAPRGMLGEGSLRIKSFKKRLFISAFKILGLPQKIRFHATDANEFESIEQVLGVNDTGISVLPNVPFIASVEDGAERSVQVVCASRISPVKNVHYLFERVASSSLDLDIHVYGTVDDKAYYEQCRSFVEQNGLKVTFHTAIPHNRLMKVLAQSRFFILPTLNENFGHAIVEAMANGCVPIISDQTPWQDLEECGAGWVIPLDQPEKWEPVLEQAGQMSEEEFSGFSKRAVEYYQKTFDISEIRTKYLELFSDQNRP